MTLQLFFFLDANLDKRVAFEIIALVEKKSPKPNGKLKKKLYIQLVKKPSKLNEKIRKKTVGGVLIDNKSPKLDKETRRKINHLYCI